MNPETIRVDMSSDLTIPAATHIVLQTVVDIAAALDVPGLYLVGGIVRDILLKRPSIDLDLVVEGDATVLAELIARQTKSKRVIHQRFKTASVYFNGVTIDLASSRSESYKHPGALPEVRPAPIGEDLLRRDFTINSMAIDLMPPNAGQLVDPLGGRKDLAKGLVRVIHNNSFIDDATRILRAVRYEQRYGFRLAQSSQRLLRMSLSMLSTISVDRLRHELERTLSEQEPELVLARASRLGVLAQVHPDFTWTPKMASQFKRLRDRGFATPKVYWSLLSLGLRSKAANELTALLKFPRAWVMCHEDSRKLSLLVDSFNDPDLKSSILCTNLDKYRVEAVQTCWAWSNSAIISERLISYLEELRQIRPILDGDELQALGLANGSNIRKIQARLRGARIDGEIVTRTDEVDLARRLANVIGPPDDWL